jgi:hypothetical protein
MQIPAPVLDTIRKMRGGLTQSYVNWLKERWAKEALALAHDRTGNPWQAGRLAMLHEIIEQLDENGRPT